MNSKLQIYSNNPDWNGTWTKAETEQEMKELDCSAKDDNAWLYWIMDHVFSFDENDLGGELEKTIIETDAIREITLALKNGKVTIIKK